MAKLQAGNLPDLQIDSLGGRMDDEFRALWSQYKPDITLPNDATAKLDRQLMFLAIARGMLRYLEDHKGDIETTEEEAGGNGTEHDHEIEFDWE